MIELLEITRDSEDLIERAGRTCYQSNDKFKGDGGLIRGLIKSGHYSVLEHAYATFRINGISRSLTHQLVRHRLASFSQQSQRYVKEDQFEYIIPDSIRDLGGEQVDNFVKNMNQIQQMYNYWKSMGIKNEDARFVLPNACCSEIVMSANFREWRHIFEMRCDSHAQWEIRKCMIHCLTILNTEAPNVFFDLAERYLKL